MNRQFWLNCGLLRLFDEFDAQPDETAPGFQYELRHPELDRLREAHHLGEVAGSGDDWAKILNLMRWMTDHIWHRGDISKALPDVCKSLPMNAHGLLDYSLGEGKDRGINCYMLSIVLTEVCLAVGIRSRLVSLNPLNPYDYDNHVVVVAWCTSLSKWVMVDPSYNAYLRDAEGRVLSPWEARDSLCRHREVIPNDELTYNRGNYNPEDYLTYLAKNLVYMQSPTFTGFDSTTRSGKPWIMLVPKGLDVCKREVYNMKWHSDGEGGSWEQEELRSAVDERRLEGSPVYTSSIDSFARPPDGAPVRTVGLRR